MPPSDLLRTRFFADVLQPCDIGMHLAAIVAHHPQPPHLPTTLCMYRPVGAAPFSGHERRLFQQCSRHVGRALELRRRADAATAALHASALGSLPLAMLGLARDRRIVLCNAPCDALLAAARGVSVRLGRLHLADPGWSTALDHALRICATRRLPEIVEFTIRLEGPPGSGLVLRLAPALGAAAASTASAAGAAAAGAMVAVGVVARESQPRPNLAQTMRALYGLSAAEAQIVEALLGGALPDEIAAQRGVRRATIKSQLRSIFAKTRTRGQRDLMRLAFSLRQQARAAAWRVGGPIDRGPLRSIWRPRQESNLHLRLRRSPFYPLNYGGAGAGL